MWEKEKLLIMSNFSFSYSVFKRLVQQTHKKGLFNHVNQHIKFGHQRVENVVGKGKTPVSIILSFTHSIFISILFWGC